MESIEKRERIRAQLANFWASKGLTKAGAARELGVSPQTISNLLARDITSRTATWLAAKWPDLNIDFLTTGEGYVSAPLEEQLCDTTQPRSLVEMKDDIIAMKEDMLRLKDELIRQQRDLIAAQAAEIQRLRGGTSEVYVAKKDGGAFLNDPSALVAGYGKK